MRGMMGKHISWLEDGERELEQNVLSEYSADRVRKHLEYLTTLTRIAGTEDERKAAEYIKGQLEEYGVGAEIYEFPAYINHPGQAELAVLSPVQASFPCLSHAFVASTPPAGMEAELIAVGRGLDEDYRDVDARGKVVLIKPGIGEGQVTAAHIAEEKGAAAQIHITSAKARAVNFMQLRSWKTMQYIPLVKYPLTSKNSLPILLSIESNALSKKIVGLSTFYQINDILQKEEDWHEDI